MNGVNETRIAAFFDVDGTLVPQPSLEWRLARWLIAGRATPLSSGFLWLANAVRLAPRGLAMMRHANKMYLRGVSTAGLGDGSSRRGQPEMAVPHFFGAGVEQMAWHAAQGHAIVLVSGTLEPLAYEVALALTVRLAVRGVAARVGVCATRLEQVNGRWTGKILGEAIFGEAKARAVRRLAFENRFDLAQCYGYADALIDRWMLEAVGRPAAVNPEQDLRRLARTKDWPIFWWRERRDALPATAGRQRAERTQRTEEIWGNLG